MSTLFRSLTATHSSISLSACTLVNHSRGPVYFQAMRVTIFGHSFAQRLGRSAFPRNLKHDDIEYRFIASGGLTWRHVHERSRGDFVRRIAETVPQCLVIIMSSNDLCDVRVSPESSLKALNAFITQIRNHFGYELPILLMPVANRTNNHKFRTGQVNLQTYIHKVAQYNKLIKIYSKLKPHMRLIQWRQMNRPTYYLPDGVHHTPQGNHSLFLAIQRNLTSFIG